MPSLQDSRTIEGEAVRTRKKPSMATLNWSDDDDLGMTPRFADRRAAGRALARWLANERDPALVVVGLARGGVETAAEVARALGAPLDVVAVRKIGHPWQPEYALGAVTPGDGVYVRGSDGLTGEQVAAAVEETKAKAAQLDGRLHAEHAALDLHGRIVLVVDDGLATGATMIAALRWARAAGASRVVAAVPVAPPQSLALIRREADEVVCPYALERFFAVGAHYASFGQVDDGAVIRLLDENRREQRAAAFRAQGL
jgi:putative phosphoribosyl transferase